MRRIARLTKPLGWKPNTSQRSIASLSTQCAAPLSRTRVATRTTCPSSLRTYSQKAPLPQSLTDGSAQQDQVLSDELGEEGIEVENEDFGSAYRAPPTRTRAAAPEQISDPSYTPATSADGLKSFGRLDDWWEHRENWDKSGDFAGFKAKKKIQDPRVLEVAVRRAIVEATVLKQAGRESEWVGTWPVGTQEDLSRVLALDVQADAQGVASLAGDHAAVAQGLSWEVQDSREVEDVQEDIVAMPSTEEATAYVNSWDPSWKQVSLADPTIKFAVIKRIFQLTGQFIPDHKLQTIDTVNALLNTLKRPEKAKTLTDDIQKTQKHLVELPNVAFSPKQVTRGDKAKATGQFKIIEEELKKRDLQDGHLAVSGSKEKHWFRGEA